MQIKKAKLKASKWVIILFANARKQNSIASKWLISNHIIRKIKKANVQNSKTFKNKKEPLELQYIIQVEQLIINRIKFEQLWPAPWLSKTLARSMSASSYFSCGHFEYPSRFSCLLFYFPKLWCGQKIHTYSTLFFFLFFSFPHFRCGDEWQTVMLTRQKEEQLLQTKSTALFFFRNKKLYLYLWFLFWNC